jgi:hypothetical protein
VWGGKSFHDDITENLRAVLANAPAVRGGDVLLFGQIKFEIIVNLWKLFQKLKFWNSL